MNRRQNWNRLVAAGVLHAYGNVPIPEWDDDDIEFIEHLDVHHSRCRCSDCARRLNVVEVQRAFAARRREDERQAKADQARHVAAKVQARPVPRIPGSIVIPVGDDPERSLAQIRAETARVANEIKFIAHLLSGEELLRYMEYRQRDCTAEIQQTAAWRKIQAAPERLIWC
jgi:hypothetical protein